MPHQDACVNAALLIYLLTHIFGILKSSFSAISKYKPFPCSDKPHCSITMRTMQDDGQDGVQNDFQDGDLDDIQDGNCCHMPHILSMYHIFPCAFHRVLMFCSDLLTVRKRDISSLRQYGWRLRSGHAVRVSSQRTRKWRVGRNDAIRPPAPLAHICISPRFSRCILTKPLFFDWVCRWIWLSSRSGRRACRGHEHLADRQHGQTG